jgi:TamB, inner membrane protein subunit of TAM complex
VLDIILDPNTGDILSSRGRGDIKVEILRTGEFNIYGRYEIEQGNYLFTMQNIINKKFDLDPGGTIVFRGDVGNALLNADAVYQVKTSTYDLISDLLVANGQLPGSDADLRSKNRINVDLLLKMKGVLQAPEISFDIRPNDPDPLVRTYVDSKLQLMHTTESEMFKQVFGLLVMNRFLPAGNSSTTDAITSGRSIGNSAANTVSEFLSSQLSMYLGSLFDNLNVRDLDINLNFKTYDQTSLAALTTDNLNARREVQLALTKKFFNNRLSVNVGGNLDFGDNYQSTGVGVSNNKSTYATGDFQVEYVLDKNGAWRAKTYNRNDYDNFNNRNINKTGIGLSFRQDFDNWADLFKRRNKKNKKQPPPPPPAKSEDAPKTSGK